MLGTESEFFARTSVDHCAISLVPSIGHLKKGVASFIPEAHELPTNYPIYYYRAGIKTTRIISKFKRNENRDDLCPRILKLCCAETAMQGYSLTASQTLPSSLFSEAVGSIRFESLNHLWI